MKVSAAGFLLLLLGVLGAGLIVTGNIDRVLGYLFSGSAPAAPVAAANPALARGTVGAQTTGISA